MKQVLLTTFDARADAIAARRTLRASAGLEPVTRIHEDEVDVQLSIALDGTPPESADERSVAGRFGAAFGGFLALGIGLDVLVMAGSDGLPMTMVCGSLGVLAGMIAVLVAELRPLDRALADITARLARGNVLLSVAVEDDRAPATRAILARHGGDVVFVT